MLTHRLDTDLNPELSLLSFVDVFVLVGMSGLPRAYGCDVDHWLSYGDATLVCHGLSVFLQPTLPLHIPRLESNDVVYAGDPQYMLDLNDLVQETMTVPGFPCSL